MNAGDTFLVPDAIGTHLYCVLALLDDDSVVLCHFTTRRRFSDPTCIVYKGEHEFFVEPESAVRYDQVHNCSGEGLAALERMIMKRLAPLSAELLARVRKGALDSPQTPDKMKEMLKPKPR